VRATTLAVIESAINGKRISTPDFETAIARVADELRELNLLLDADQSYEKNALFKWNETVEGPYSKIRGELKRRKNRSSFE